MLRSSAGLAEGVAEARVEGIEEDVLDGLEAELGFVEFAAALGLADVAPVGGTIAGAAKALGVDEGFQENGGKAVAVFPIEGELGRGAREDVGGEVFDPDPREDEEPGIVDHEVQVAFSLLGGPANEDVRLSSVEASVARGNGPGGGAESQGREQLGFAPPPPVGPDQIAKLRPGQRCVAEIVIAFDQFIPQRRVVGRTDRAQNDGAQLFQRELDRCVRVAGRRRLRLDPAVVIFRERRWQANQAVAFHAEHGHAARHLLEGAVRANPAQLLAEASGKAGAMERGIGGDQPANPVHLFLGKVPTTIAIGHSSFLR